MPKHKKVDPFAPAIANRNWFLNSLREREKREKKINLLFIAACLEVMRLNQIDTEKGWGALPDWR